MSLREEQCNKVCRILDDVLANRPTERDSLIVATRSAFSALSELGTNLAEVGTEKMKKRTVKGFPIDADLLMLKVEEEYGFRARDKLYGIIRYMPKYELPSARPERERGKWELHDGSCEYLKGYRCDQCGQVVYDTVLGKPLWDFCPSCGADMRGDQDGQQ